MTMATGWLLLLLLIVSSQSADSQSPTDDETCDDEASLCKQQKDTARRVDSQQRLLFQVRQTALDNQQQILDQKEMQLDIQQQLQTLLENQQQIFRVLHQHQTTYSAELTDQRGSYTFT